MCCSKQKEPQHIKIPEQYTAEICELWMSYWEDPSNPDASTHFCLWDRIFAYIPEARGRKWKLVNRTARFLELIEVLD